MKQNEDIMWGYVMRIETERLIITEFSKEMAQVVHENSLDEDNRKFVPDEVFETVDEARETIEFLMSQYDSEDGPLVYPVLLLRMTIILAMCSLFLSRKDGKLDITLQKNILGMDMRLKL